MQMFIRYKVDRALGEDVYSGTVSVDDGDGGVEPFERLPQSDLFSLIVGMVHDCIPDEIYVRIGSGRRQQLSDDTVVRLTTGECCVEDILAGE